MHLAAGSTWLWVLRRLAGVAAQDVQKDSMEKVVFGELVPPSCSCISRGSRVENKKNLIRKNKKFKKISHSASSLASKNPVGFPR